MKEKRIIDSAGTSSGYWASMFIHYPSWLLKALQKNNISSITCQQYKVMTKSGIRHFKALILKIPPLGEVEVMALLCFPNPSGANVNGKIQKLTYPVKEKFKNCQIINGVQRNSL